MAAKGLKRVPVIGSQLFSRADHCKLLHRKEQYRIITISAIIRSTLKNSIFLVKFPYTIVAMSCSFITPKNTSCIHTEARFINQLQKHYRTCQWWKKSIEIGHRNKSHKLQIWIIRFVFWATNVNLLQENKASLFIFLEKLCA